MYIFSKLTATPLKSLLDQCRIRRAFTKRRKICAEYNFKYSSQGWRCVLVFFLIKFISLPRKSCDGLNASVMEQLWMTRLTGFNVFKSSHRK